MKLVSPRKSESSDIFCLRRSFPVYRGFHLAHNEKGVIFTTFELLESSVLYFTNWSKTSQSQSILLEVMSMVAGTE